jgi:hypothetical protein
MGNHCKGTGERQDKRRTSIGASQVAKPDLVALLVERHRKNQNEDDVVVREDMSDLHLQRGTPTTTPTQLRAPAHPSTFALTPTFCRPALKATNSGTATEKKTRRRERKRKEKTKNRTPINDQQQWKEGKEKRR